MKIKSQFLETLLSLNEDLICNLDDKRNKMSLSYISKDVFEREENIIILIKKDPNSLMKQLKRKEKQEELKKRIEEEE